MKGYLRTCYTSMSFSATPGAENKHGLGCQAQLKTGNAPKVSFCCVAATQKLSSLKEQIFINSHDFPGLTGSFWSGLGGVEWPHSHAWAHSATHRACSQGGRMVSAARAAKPQCRSTFYASAGIPFSHTPLTNKSTVTVREILQNAVATSFSFTTSTTLKTGIKSKFISRTTTDVF